MYEDDFPKRLTQLRQKRGISARDMSLSIGQNPGYINTIENGKSFPTMSNFFYICEFLNISPRDFFDMETENLEKVNEAEKRLKLLNEQQLDAVNVLLKGLTDPEKPRRVHDAAHSVSGDSASGKRMK